MTNISNCTFTGVNYDAKAVEAITIIANGLTVNATALSKLAEVLKASNVTVESLVKLDNPVPDIKLEPLSAEKLKRVNGKRKSA